MYLKRIVVSKDQITHHNRSLQILDQCSSHSHNTSLHVFQYVNMISSCYKTITIFKPFMIKTINKKILHGKCTSPCSKIYLLTLYKWIYRSLYYIQFRQKQCWKTVLGKVLDFYPLPILEKRNRQKTYVKAFIQQCE